MARFASGKHALGECDRCGFAVPYRSLSAEITQGRPNGLRVCPACLDKDHPQETLLPRIRPDDPQALQFARPQQNLDQQRQMRRPSYIPTPYIGPVATDCVPLLNYGWQAGTAANGGFPLDGIGRSASGVVRDPTFVTTLLNFESAGDPWRDQSRYNLTFTPTPATPNGNQGVLRTTPGFNGSAGALQSYFTFSGVVAFLSARHPFTIGTQNFTIEAWVLNQNGTHCAIGLFDPVGALDSISAHKPIVVANGGPIQAFYNGGAVSNLALATGWQHVFFARRGSLSFVGGGGNWATNNDLGIWPFSSSTDVIVGGVNSTGFANGAGTTVDGARVTIGEARYIPANATSSGGANPFGTYTIPSFPLIDDSL